MWQRSARTLKMAKDRLKLAIFAVFALTVGAAFAVSVARPSSCGKRQCLYKGHCVSASVCRFMISCINEKQTESYCQELLNLFQSFPVKGRSSSVKCLKEECRIRGTCFLPFACKRYKKCIAGEHSVGFCEGAIFLLTRKLRRGGQEGGNHVAAVENQKFAKKLKSLAKVKMGKNGREHGRKRGRGRGKKQFRKIVRKQSQKVRRQKQRKAAPPCGKARHGRACRRRFPRRFRKVVGKKLSRKGRKLTNSNEKEMDFMKGGIVARHGRHLTAAAKKDASFFECHYKKTEERRKLEALNAKIRAYNAKQSALVKPKKLGFLARVHRSMRRAFGRSRRKEKTKKIHLKKLKKVLSHRDIARICHKKSEDRKKMIAYINELKRRQKEIERQQKKKKSEDRKKITAYINELKRRQKEIERQRKKKRSEDRKKIAAYINDSRKKATASIDELKRLGKKKARQNRERVTALINRRKQKARQNRARKKVVVNGRKGKKNEKNSKDRSKKAERTINKSRKNLNGKKQLKRQSGCSNLISKLGKQMDKRISAIQLMIHEVMKEVKRRKSYKAKINQRRKSLKLT